MASAFARTSMLAAARTSRVSAGRHLRARAISTTVPALKWDNEGPFPKDHFNTPGYVTDMNQTGLAAWSKWVDDNMDLYHTNDRSTNIEQFFNPLDVAQTKFAEKEISWVGFPRRVLVKYGNSGMKRFEVADSSRDNQDEYLEWSVTRNADGKITKVQFTSEGPEYWRFLTTQDPDKVLSLYHDLVGPQVEKSDIYTAQGRYIPRNKWNSNTSTGAVHLIQRNNTLGAEINLAANACIVRKDDKGEVITDSQELILCSKYGQPSRNSDPHIGAEVNALARAGFMVSLANPVALYIKGFTPAGFITPDGTDASEFWSITRGTEEFALAASFEVPDGKGYTVSDIQTTPGTFIQFGSQLTDFIRVKLSGIAIDQDPSRVHPESCPR